MSTLALYLIATALVAYLLGGVNGAIIASFNVFKKDIRKFGSGNAGLTNFLRTFGSKGLVIVIIVDVLKTIISGLFGSWLVGKAGYPAVGIMLAGFCSMLGHVYPIYYRFHGGKSVLCAGVIAWMIDWRVGLLCWFIFLVIVLFTKFVSLGSMLASLFMPIALLIFHHSGTEALLGLLCALLLIFSHRENIKRLKNGTESKLSFGNGKSG